MPRDWHPQAQKVPMEHAGTYTGGAWKVLLHSTEGGSAAGAFGAYRAKRSAPHLTVTVERGRFEIFQHIPFSRAGRALEHPAGIGDTNRNRNIQIEMVGFCGKGFNDTMYRGMAGLIDWLCGEFNISKRASFGFSNCARQTRRLSWGEWNRYSGVLGHQHVPGNHHTDPGALNVDKLLGGHRPASRTIKQGVSGADVADFQRSLNKRLAARKKPTIDADGEYGARTERARDIVLYDLGFPLGVCRGDGASKRVQALVRDPKKRPNTYLTTAVKRKAAHQRAESKPAEAKH